MGLDAELLAIGPYSQRVRDHLEYPGSFYGDVHDGSLVISSVVCCSGTATSIRLAKMLGVDPWTLDKHCNIPVAGFDAELLTDIAEDGVRAVQRFDALRSAGFRFYFMPRPRGQLWPQRR
jgi:hypothetical protein